MSLLFPIDGDTLGAAYYFKNNNLQRVNVLHDASDTFFNLIFIKKKGLWNTSEKEIKKKRNHEEWKIKINWKKKKINKGE